MIMMHPSRSPSSRLHSAAGGSFISPPICGNLSNSALRYLYGTRREKSSLTRWSATWFKVWPFPEMTPTCCPRSGLGWRTSLSRFLESTTCPELTVFPWAEDFESRYLFHQPNFRTFCEGLYGPRTFFEGGHIQFIYCHRPFREFTLGEFQHYRHRAVFS